MSKQSTETSETTKPTGDVPEAARDWWRDFFRGPFGALQVGGIHEDRSVAESDLICQWLGLGARSRVLDAPCGTGRIAVELARRGHDVTAIDFNPDVLERGRHLAQQASVTVDFREQDLRELNDRQCYDAALCWWGSYGYFSDEDNQLFLERVADSLVDGGRFVLDLPVHETFYPQFRERDWDAITLPDGTNMQVLESRQLDFERGRAIVTWTFIGPTTREEHTVSLRVPSYRELCDALRRAGFTAFAAYERPSGKPFRFGSSRLCLVATK